MITTTSRRQVSGVAIQRRTVINLVTLILRYSYLISLETVIGYRKLRSLQETQVNLRVLLEKPDVTYPSQNT